MSSPQVITDVVLLQAGQHKWMTIRCPERRDGQEHPPAEACQKCPFHTETGCSPVIGRAMTVNTKYHIKEDSHDKNR